MIAKRSCAASDGTRPGIVVSMKAEVEARQEPSETVLSRDLRLDLFRAAA